MSMQASRLQRGSVKSNDDLTSTLPRSEVCVTLWPGLPAPSFPIHRLAASLRPVFTALLGKPHE